MEIKELALLLAKEAKRKGICVPWYQELLGLRSKRAMIDMYIRGIDFCIDKEFPSKNIIESHFKGTMETQGVFLDEEIKEKKLPRYVCLGETSGEISASNYDVCEVFLKHKSNVRINASGHAFIMVEQYDDTRLEVVARDDAKVCIMHHGGELAPLASDFAAIKVVEKTKQ